MGFLDGVISLAGEVVDVVQDKRAKKSGVTSRAGPPGFGGDFNMALDNVGPDAMSRDVGMDGVEGNGNGNGGCGCCGTQRKQYTCEEKKAYNDAMSVKCQGCSQWFKRNWVDKCGNTGKRRYYKKRTYRKKKRRSCSRY